jgi:hypothetical protein|nr:MAG TPA: hypothetical protein [Caudoviricetes sp.]
MNVTAECINATPVDYGYFPVKTLNLYYSNLPYILHQGVPHYLGSLSSMYLDIDFPDLMNYDAIVIMDDVHVRDNKSIVFNSMLCHPIRFIAECLSIPLIFCTTREHYIKLKQNETDLFKPVVSLNSLKKAIKALGLTSNSNVYVLNAWRNYQFDKPEIILHTKYGLKFLKEY